MAVVLRPCRGVNLFPTDVVSCTELVAGVSRDYPAGVNSVYIHVANLSIIKIGVGVVAALNDGIVVPGGSSLMIDLENMNLTSPWRVSNLRLLSTGVTTCYVTPCSTRGL